MSRTDPAGIHFHSFWSTRAHSPALPPLWMRIVALAYSSHGKSGHAPFYLCGDSTLPPEILHKSKKHIQKEIARAIELGFLAEGSNINCLVLPDEICGGAEGHAFGECKLHR